MNEQFRSATALLGLGSYSAGEAARLIGTNSRNIRRWLGGYRYKRADVIVQVPPLWTPEIPLDDDHLEISFRDLIELRFIKAFGDAGVGLKAIRNCLDYARTLAARDYPFATRRFRTDGRTIFLESLEQSGDVSLLDLKRRQFAFKEVIDRTFRDLDIEDDTVARWRPYRGKDSIVIDPGRAFGQPIAAAYGVPTVALADAVAAEGSEERVADVFEVSLPVVRDAIGFEGSILAP